MQVVERSAIVTHTAAEMYALVDDVGRYPEFLPWCTGAQVRTISSEERLATVQVARGVLRSAFTTRNTVQPGSRLLMQLVEGPFRHLIGEWRFENIGDRGSRVHFRIEFEFKSRFMAAAFGAAFETVCSTIVDAFVQRAAKIHGG